MPVVDRPHPGVKVFNQDQIETLLTEEQEWVVFIVQLLKPATSLLFLKILLPNAFNDALEDLCDADFLGDQECCGQRADGMVAEALTNPVGMQMDLATDAEANILSKFALNAELRDQQEMCQCDNLMNETCKHILPIVRAFFAGAKQAAMCAKEETLRKICCSVSWITEAAADVFSGSVTKMDAVLEWCHILTVEVTICTLSNWDQSLLIEFYLLSFPGVLFTVPHHRCRESRQDKLADQ